MEAIKFRQAIKEDRAHFNINVPDAELSFERWHYWGYIIGEEFVGPISKVEWDNRPSYPYIGRKDKNGKEIYEGDIYKQIWRGKEIIGKIVYGDMARYWLEPYEYYHIGVIKITGEVIGNICENPELLRNQIRGITL